MRKRYVVTGIHRVLGHAPGEEFAADLPPEQEQHLLRARALKLAPPPRPARDEKPRQETKPRVEE